MVLAFDPFFFAFDPLTVNDMVSSDMQEIADGASCWDNGQFHSVGVNPDWGSGYLSRVKSFPSGISMVIQDFSLNGDGEIRLFRDRYEANLPFIGFFTCLSGVGHISYSRPRVSLGNGFSNIEFSGYESALFMDVKANTPIRTLIVCVDPPILVELTGKSCDELVETLGMLDDKAGRGNLPVRSNNLDFAQKLCGHQAFASFMDRPHDTLFLEAKALEMVALQLRQLEYLTGKSPKVQSAGHHMDQISHACEILKKEMVTPPKARELARRVGLNHNQLVQGFKQVLGICPFEYLRITRLEKARHLIGSHECSITEAAFNVGYSSLSHFTKSFQKEFGINPKAHARRK